MSMTVALDSSQLTTNIIWRAVKKFGRKQPFPRRVPRPRPGQQSVGVRRVAVGDDGLL